MLRSLRVNSSKASSAFQKATIKSNQNTKVFIANDKSIAQYINNKKFSNFFGYFISTVFSTKKQLHTDTNLSTRFYTSVESKNTFSSMKKITLSNSLKKSYLLTMLLGLLMAFSSYGQCGFNNTNFSNQQCNDNTTSSDTTDDYITFNLEPTAQEASQMSYNVTVDNGGTVTRQDGSPATNIPYSGVGCCPALRLQNGSADGVTQYTITLTDVDDPTCTITQVVAIQNTCSDNSVPAVPSSMAMVSECQVFGNESVDVFTPNTTGESTATVLNRGTVNTVGLAQNPPVGLPFLNAFFANAPIFDGAQFPSFTAAGLAGQTAIQTDLNGTFTSTFSNTVTNPILVLTSLGGLNNQNLIRTVVFDTDFIIVDVYNSSAPTGDASIVATVDAAARTVTGAEDGLVLQFLGTFPAGSSIVWQTGVTEQGNAAAVDDDFIYGWFLPSGIETLAYTSNNDCNTATDTYTADVAVTFINPPTTGTLDVSFNGGTGSASAPFTSPQTVTVTGINANEATADITANFSGDATGCGNVLSTTADTSCAVVIDPCDPIASGNPDFDGDGISDICDIDDDNDGVLDTVECPTQPCTNDQNLDSDADGCSDAAEAGVPQAQGMPTDDFQFNTSQGTGNGDENGDGLADVVDRNGNSIPDYQEVGNDTYNLAIDGIASSNCDPITTPDTSCSGTLGMVSNPPIDGLFDLFTSVGQSFLANATGDGLIVEASIYYTSSQIPSADLFLEIYNGDTVTGTPAYTQALDANNIPNNGSGLSTALAIPFPVTMGNMYTIRLFTTDTANPFRIFVTFNNAYPDGQLYTNGALNPDPLLDLGFQVDICVPPADDMDNVDTAIEDGAPGNGDGNGDGMLDSLQPNVASIPDGSGTGDYVTIEVTGACSQITRMIIEQEVDLASLDENFEYPFGLVDFTLDCVNPGESATVKYYWYGISSLSDLDAYRKFGPSTPGDALTNSYQSNFGINYTNDFEIVNGQTVYFIQYTLTDGQEGDETALDGEIIDPTGPAVAASCMITGPNVFNQQCNDNGTPNDITDDYITFSMEPSSINSNTYSVTVDNGGVITFLNGAAPINIAYNTPPTLRLQTGSADGVTQYTITLTDDVDNTCFLTEILVVQAVCSAADPCDPVASGNTDTDGDGISDVCDLDDDNDGILDTEEGFICENYSFDFGGQISVLAGPGGNPNVVGDTFLRDDAIVGDLGTNYDVVMRIESLSSAPGVSAVAGANEFLFIQGSPSNNYWVEFSVSVVEDGSATTATPEGKKVIVDNLQLIINDIDSNGGADFTEVFGIATNLNAQISLGSRLTTGGFVAGDAPTIGFDYYRLIDGDPSPNLDWSANVGSANNDQRNFITTVMSNFSTGNFIYGVTGSNTGNPVRGAPALLDGSVTSCFSSDFDGDGIPNLLDLDSDNDGIYDVVESGGVDINNDGLADDDDDNADNTGTDGIPTSAGTGNAPIDSGSIPGTPDYLDVDSDNDGCPDAVEAAGTFMLTDLTPSNNLTDPSSGTVDANGVPNNGGSQLQSTTIDVITDGPDIDGDGIADACDPTDDRPDNDMDGIPDAVDLDDDNDGILDTDEGICFENLAFDWEGKTIDNNVPSTVSETINGNLVTVNFNGDGWGAPNPNLSTGGNARNLFDDEDVDGNGTGDNVIINLRSDNGDFYNVNTEANQINTNVQFAQPILNLKFSVADVDFSDFVAIYAIDSNGNTIYPNVSAVPGFTPEWSIYNVSDPINPVSNRVTVVGDGSNTNTSGSTVYFDFNGNLISSVFIRSGYLDTDGFYDVPDANNNPNGTNQSNGFVQLGDFIYCNSRDTDGDTIPDYLDTDSDNDGCPDAVEAAGMFEQTDLIANGSLTDDPLAVDTDPMSAAYGVPLVAGAGQAITVDVTNDGPDLDGDGIADACDPTDDRPDNDNDGVPDVVDLDDDNDGILDSIECPTMLTVVDFSTLTSAQRNTLSGPNGGTVTLDTGIVGINGMNITVDITSAGAPNSLNPSIVNLDMAIVNNSFDDRRDSSGTSGNLITFTYSEPVYFEVTSEPHSFFGNDENIRVSSTAILDGFIDATTTVANVNPTLLSDNGSIDTTGDNQPNYLLTGDNTQNIAFISRDYFSGSAPGSGTPAGDPEQGNGTFWGVTSNGVTTQNFSIEYFRTDMVEFAGREPYRIAIGTCPDFDGDGNPNFLDLDSDNDGIYDVTESGGTDANNDGLADDDDNNADNTATDGIPTSAGTGNTPTDSGPTQGTPDFLDYDSDEDGCSDANEAYGNTTADGGDGGQYGAGTPTVNPDGTVNGAGLYPTTNFPADLNTNTTADYTEVGTPASDNDNTLPANVTTIVGATETFTSDFLGTDLAYQWFVQTPMSASFVPLADGGIYSGVTTATLTLTGIQFTDNGNRYRVEVNGGSVCDAALISNEALLTVENYYIQIRPLTDGSENNAGATSPVQYEVYLSTDPEGLNEVTNTSGAPITGDVTFPTGGTATSADVGTLPTTFSIPDGSATATIDAPVVNDDEVEGTETLIAQISNPSGTVNLGDNDQATGNIIDADVTGTTVSIELVQNGTEDGDDLVYQVIIRDVNGNPVTNNTGVDITADVMFAGGATAADFTATFPNGITIPDGASSTLITLPVNDDLLIEADDAGTATPNDEVLTATLSNLAGGAGTEVLGAPSADGSVIDNDTNIEVVLTVVMNGSENGLIGGDEVDLQYEITLTDGMGNILTNATGADINTTILSTPASTADITPGGDFDSAGPPVPDTTTGIVYTIPSGDSSVLLNYEVVEDLLVEASETLVLTQGTTTGATGLTFTIGGTDPVTGTISDNDDTDAHVQIVLNQNGSEGSDIAPGDETPVIFDILLFNGDSTNPSAMAANNGTTENLEVTVSFSIATVNNDDITQDISMPITVSIAPGTGIASITLDVFDDFNIENLEDITATITNVAYANPLPGPNPPTVDIDTVLDSDIGTITDNDNDVIFDVTVTPANGSEGPLTTPGDEVDLTYTVTLVNANGDVLTNTTGGDIVADISFDPSGTATQADFNTTFPTTISIPDQASDGSTTLAVLDDGIIEGDETLIFVADSNPANPASLNITSGNATGTVTDNDVANVKVTATEPLGNEEGAIPGEFTVALVDSAGNPIVSSTDTVVTYTIGGTATNDGSDYTQITTFTVTIPAGSSEAVIPVPVIDDTEVEGMTNETVVIDLTGVTGDPEVMLSTTPADITATVEIIDNDTPPMVVIAMPTETITEDTDLTFTGVGGNGLSITDGDGQDQTVTINVTNGTLDLTDIPGLSIIGDGTGSITLSGNLADINQALEGAVFSPDPGFNGTATIEIETTDTSGNSDTVADGDNNTVTITVESAPDAVDDDFVTDEDVPVNGDLFANNGNGSDDLGTTATTVINNTDPSNGTVVVNPDGTFTYTPAPNFSGTDTFEYTIQDANGETSTATATIVVNPVIDIMPDNEVTDEDTPVDIDVLANDNFTGTYGTDYEITSSTTPTNGTVSVDPTTGLVTYTPNADFNGTDSFEYTVTVNNPDGTTSTETTTVDVVVNPVDDAIDDMATTGEDIPVTIDVSMNDTFSNPNSVITDVADPINGSVILNGDGTITYLPDSMFSGTDTFTYTVTTTNADGTMTTEVATVTVVIEEDSDEDGIPDSIDLDDDNDGITDLVEGGGVDGSADDDGDGVPNYLDDAPADPLVGDVNGMIETGFDTDMDGVPNHLDLDADNDGIFDVLEVGGTDGDGDGIADGPTDGVTGIPVIAGPGYTAIDSDSGTPNADGVPDFLDQDSDGDGCSDSNEAFADANADGGDGGSYGTGEPQLAVNPNGTVIGANYAIGANADVTTFGPDPDGDGIANTCDDDDDNDGNPDPTDPNPLVPTAVDDMGMTDVFTPVTIDIIGNDDFISNNDPLNMNPITIVEVPGGTATGIVVIDETTGELTYTPASGENGPVTILYQVCNDTDMDGTQNSPPDACDTATVIITIDGDDDGDGTPNGSDPEPNNPCVDDGTIGDEDLTNAVYLAGDCDGDGVTNGDELTPPDGETPTDPYDGCSYVDADQDYATTSMAYQNADCDGDGVTNGNEIDPTGTGTNDGDGTDEMDPCDYNPILVTLTPTAAFQLADCDGDGTPNGSDPDPLDPCVDDGTLGDEDSTNPIWAMADCDGDGTPNGTDPDPQDPCVDDGTVGDEDATNPIWTAADCDGDGTPNGTDPDPLDPCVDDGVTGDEDITNVIYAAADCDGDGTPNGTDPDPNDPCVDDGTVGDEDATNPIWTMADCDGDGTPNGTDPNPQDPCVDDGTVGDEDATNPVWAMADCDGDGTPNGSDLDPQDPCVDDGVTGDEDITNAIYAAADCDGDGTPNGTDPDPNDPCVDDGTVGDEDATNPIWAMADCDGDGDPNGNDPDPQDPCVFTAGSVGDPTNPIFAAADCDGDGTPNGSDPDPNDPCVGGDITMVDLTNTTSDWALADCDGDGVPNLTEEDPNGTGMPGDPAATDSQDPCDYDSANQDYTTTTVAYQALDCDGDGVTNGDEIDPDGNGMDDNDGDTTDEQDPCDYNPILVTLTPTAAFQLADCDGDGTPNGSDPDPLDPCVDDGTLGDEDSTNPIWAMADCDGDGTPNGTDPDPKDPCVDDGTVGDEDATNPIWTAADCDGDGTPNGTDPDPLDPCVDDGVTGDEDITNVIYAAADCDGDGTPNGTDPDPNDPCVDDGTVGDEDETNPIWAMADCDGDGDPNGNDPDPQDPCVFTAGSVGDPTNPIYAAADCDGDGTPNGTDPDPNDPCVDDGTEGDEDGTNPIWTMADCDGDGTPNGTDPDPQDPCVDDGTIGDEDATNPIWANADCDGDGTPNGTDPDPHDPCVDDGTVGDEDITNAIYAAADCDGDGTPNGTDPDPNDPCVDDGTVGDEDETNPIWAMADCDGDGDPNGNDPDPQDPCVFTAGSVGDPTNPIFAAADCDGDGTPNGSDPDPNDPCVGGDITMVDFTNTTSDWALADCDGDGVPNLTEEDPNGTGMPGDPAATDSQDPCDYDSANQDYTTTTVAYQALDCDGDGVTNGDEIDPDGNGMDDNDGDTTDEMDPCDYNPILVTLTPTAAYLLADCDGDGTPNGSDPDPLDPCVGVDITGVDFTDMTSDWYLADCDGDGTPNGPEEDPNGDGTPGDPDSSDSTDPCDDNGTVGDEHISNMIFADADCDGDGVTNGDEIDPDGDGIPNTDGTETDWNDPCDFNAADITLTPMGDWDVADCDGDGTPNGMDSDPNDPCVDADVTGVDFTDMTSDWYVADCDGDGVPNGLEEDPNGDGTPGDPDATDSENPCDYDSANQDYATTTTAYQALDCDGDGVTNGDEIDPDGNGMDDNDGTDEMDPCDYNPILVTLTPTAAYLLADCDGDGTPNGSDPNPEDPCIGGNVSGVDFTDMTSDWYLADCDGDGTPNGMEEDPNGDGTPGDPDSSDSTDPCDDNGIVGDEDINNMIFADADCDGDGVTNGDEIDPDGDGTPNTDGTETDWNDPCDFNVLDITLPQGGDWNTEDCDGDGTPNGLDPDPQDPCVGGDITMVDLMDTTSDWATADCDGDGVTNIDEVDPTGTGTDDGDGTDPNDGCDYDSTQQDITMVSTMWEALDCDGDGVTNGDEVGDMTDPQNPCDYNAVNQDLTNVTSEWNSIDCDMDGLTNGEETTGNDDPNTPNDPNGNTTDPLDPDTDGDGVDDGTEAGDMTDPNDPCDYEVGSQDITTVDANWNNADCDGDGVTNGQEVTDMTDPLNPCDYDAANQDVTMVTSEWEDADCDGDGVTNGEEVDDMTDPLDPCSFNPNSQDDSMTSTEYDLLDCDGDGVINGVEIADGTNPLDPCDYEMMSQDETIVTPEWEAIDCDGDGVFNGQELTDMTDPQDPCDFISASQDVTIISTAFADLDCDGDGVTNGQEALDGTDPNDFCDYELTSQTLDPSDEFNNTDCDGDGVNNGQEIIDGTDPSDPCDYDFNSQSINYANQTVEGVSDMWLLLDCDGDNIPNGEEIADNNDNGIPDYNEVNNSDPNAPDGLEIFDIMTPNEDGLNDVFTIRGIEQYPNNTLRIYNRWGVKVYDVDGYGQSGKFFRGISEGRVTIKKEDKLPVGTYYYVLEYVNDTGNRVSKAGPLYINRK